MRTGIVLWAVFCTATAVAQDQQVAVATGRPRIDLDSITALILTVTSCAALHSAAADMLDREHLPAYAETARRRAQVDQTTATYLLAQNQTAKGGTPRELSSFTSYVEQLTAAARDRMAGIVNAKDAQPFQREESICSELIPLEDEVLAKITAD